MRVAIQGERGAFSEQAAMIVFGPVEVLPCRWFNDAFHAVLNKTADYGVIPIENSHSGSIYDTYDLLLQHDLHIVGEVDLPIVHCLLAIPGMTVQAVKRVYSHPQALAQCEEFITKLGVEKIAYEDTAGSARLVGENQWKDAAAIAGKRAGEIYGLNLLEEGIQTNADNRTRFVVLSLKPEIKPSEKGYKTSVVFVTQNIPGSLYLCLGALATRKINLVKIESRPYRLKAWDYIFYLDFEGSMEDPVVQEALNDLRARSSFVKVLGSYPKAT